MGEAWVDDITYIWTTEGWSYLAVLIDLDSRKVVGWASLSLESHLPWRATTTTVSGENSLTALCR